MKSIVSGVIFLAVLSIFSFLIIAGDGSGHYIVYLPISVLLFCLFFKRKLDHFKSSIVFYLLFAQIVIRYLILPVLIEMGDWIKVDFQSMYSGETVFFMVIELLTVLIILSFYSRKQKIAFENKKHISIFLKPNLLILIFIVSSIIFIDASGYFSRVNYIWELDSFLEERGNSKDISSLAGVLFYTIRILISIILFSYIYTKNWKNHYKVFFLFLIIALNSIIIVETSRFSIVLTVLPLFVIMYTVFEKLKRQILFGILILFIPVITITTVAKSFRSYNNISPSIINANSLNAYFSGPNNVSTGLKLYYSKDNWSRFDFLFNDLFQNVPVISNYTNDNYKTTIFFNEQVYNARFSQDQIVPLILSGLIHFDVAGVLIYPTLFICLALFFERKFFEEINIGYKYVFVSLSIGLSLIFMLNIGSLMSHIFRNIFFLYIPITVISKVIKLNKR